MPPHVRRSLIVSTVILIALCTTQTGLATITALSNLTAAGNVDSIAVDSSSGDVYAISTTGAMSHFNNSGIGLLSWSVPGFTSTGAANMITVGSGGVYVIKAGDPAPIQHYTSGGTLLGSFGNAVLDSPGAPALPGTAYSITTGHSGDVFVASTVNAFFHYDASGAFIEPDNFPTGSLAYDPVADKIYAAFSGLLVDYATTNPVGNATIKQYAVQNGVVYWTDGSKLYDMATPISQGGANVITTGTLSGVGASDYGIVYVGDGSTIHRYFDDTLWTRGLNPVTSNITVAPGTSWGAQLNAEAGSARAISGNLTVGLGGEVNVTSGASFTANNINLGFGSTTSINGSLNGKVVAAAGSSITLTGDATMGALFVNGFYSGGEIIMGGHNLTLLDSNDAVLDSSAYINMAGGTLTAANGLTLNLGGNIEGNGVINTPNTLAKRTIINGNITGLGVHQQIELTGYIKGIGNFDNVVFSGTYSPGFSPALVNVGSIGYTDSSVLEMEIAGLTAGSQYDKIVSSGTITFDGTLLITLLDGFVPSVGNSFDLFDGSLVGTFDSMVLPSLAPGAFWDTSRLYSDGILSVVAVAVPTPAALPAGLLLLAGLVLRRRR